MRKLRPLQILSHIHFNDRSRPDRPVDTACLRHDHCRIDRREDAQALQRIPRDKPVDGIALEQRHDNVNSRKHDIQSQRDREIFPIGLEKRQHLRPCPEAERLIIFLFFICRHLRSPPSCRAYSSCHPGSSVYRRSGGISHSFGSAPDVCPSLLSCHG